MQREKEQWIDKMMQTSATDSLKPSGELFARITEKLDNENLSAGTVNFRQYRLAIAATITLVILNAGYFAVNYFNSASPKQTGSYFQSYDLNIY